MIILMVVHDSTVPGQIDPMGCGDNLELESSRIYNAWLLRNNFKNIHTMCFDNSKRTFKIVLLKNDITDKIICSNINNMNFSICIVSDESDE